MKEAGITSEQLAIAKENASVVTDSNVDINNTNVPPASGGSRGTGSVSGSRTTTSPNTATSTQKSVHNPYGKKVVKLIEIK